MLLLSLLVVLPSSLAVCYASGTDVLPLLIPTPLAINAALSVAAFIATLQLIPALSSLFVNAGLFGMDLNKPIQNRVKVPEALGVICGAVYLICLFFFIPFPFIENLPDDVAEPVSDALLLHDGDRAAANAAYEALVVLHNEKNQRMFRSFLGALLSICCMIFLGFADDVLNLRWRHKLMLPTIATLPILMVYFANHGVTSVIFPKFAMPFLPSFMLQSDQTVFLGPLYYVFMGMIAVFCTNAINILAGINGLEAGQSIVIAISIAINNAVQIFLIQDADVQNHLFSLYLMLPFIATTAALLWWNWFPSRVFVGDTFCYFAGMTFAVVGILGHFSKTLLLLFIPQVLNFVYSLPQLFHLVPCPRHRMPKFDPATGLVGNSHAYFKMSELSGVGRIIVTTMRIFRLVTYKELSQQDYVLALAAEQASKTGADLGKGRAEATTLPKPEPQPPATPRATRALKRNQPPHQSDDASSSASKPEEPIIQMSNLTLINFSLMLTGPQKEGQVTCNLLLFQAVCSGIAFFIRYYIAAWLYRDV
ncbi:dolichyl-phosphate acetylglucosaminephosphotransferase 1 [Capsaspora owczarzaki ATCC 30864]|uniref:UDP-N-acetylglucosamine--dolichyl-phosphate N-acetylglucosaminephosphotransferase n=1 Tax=Capsaspora owczarzaki (strain ATCC 30864) TaxID=595528 RepID=A0A0D2VUW0_CAPO3|nr:dolichyl-phosphate acetylglucosaminephosphotransferase 1 [Capsaspora owczarzaki ATCC 30864]KJE95172.1 dolichyl-phosphate acetylglucosaminephosphotransferase 1 [Capsaspora owczarzaki ATCC 30864]|eukprot:XP_004346324.1 dolichyl-phosphate acetylglucosaminephosphotransferase 1 [Capsaspora owczarzaki ATCC 30864]